MIASVLALTGLMTACGPADTSEHVSAPVDGSAPQLGLTELTDDVRDGTVLVVGDSLAHALGEGLSAVIDDGGSRDVTIVNAAIGGCGLLLPVEQKVSGEMGPTNPECNAWPTRWPELVAEYQPDYVYLSTSFWDEVVQVIDEGGAPGTLADTAFQDRWVENATTAIQLLSADGARVFLDDLNGEGLHGVQARAVEASGAASILPLRGQMCADEGCPPVIDGVRVLDDTGHPAGESRDRLARWILSEMFAHVS